MSKGHISRNSKSPKPQKPRSKDRAVTRVAGRRERHAAETRVRLFRCALGLIAKRGLANVTVEDITEAADVGKGTFFNYFASKDHLLGVMAEIQLGKIREALKQVGRGTRTTKSVLHQLALRLSEEPGRNPRLARALISSFLASPNVRQILKRNIHEGRKSIGEIVAAGQRRREINRKLKKEKVAMQLLQSVLGTVLLWSLHERPKLKSWVEESFQSFWRSIATAGSQQG